NWADYAPYLHTYAEDRMDGGRLPGHIDFADWFAARYPSLVANPVQRDINLAIAIQILPLFEADPQNAWTALSYLNQGPLVNNATLVSYFESWYDRVPHEQQMFIYNLAA